MGEFAQREKARSEPFRVRLPGFIVSEDIGLGDVAKAVTSYIGIPPCQDCQQRAAALNHRFVFTRGRQV
jgi:hypothetical protein